MMEIKALFGLQPGSVTAIVGCGGKTGLLYLLASELRETAVLIGTTTRIWTPPPGVFERLLRPGEDLRRENGVTLAFNGEENGKLLPFPTDGLDRARRFFDYVIIECDGSKNRPLKGWADHEPVLPDFTGVTVGVVSPKPAGAPLSEQNTHRIAEFCGITGAVPGETVTPAHIASMICHPRGLMQKARGAKVLLINQVEDQASEKCALDILSRLPEGFVKNLSRILVGSVHQKKFKLIKGI